RRAAAPGRRGGRAPGAGARAPGPAGVPQHDGGGEPPHGGLLQGRPVEGLRGACGPRLRDLPPARRAPAPGGRQALRRRAADARHRPGAAVGAEGRAHRRAVARPRPEDGAHAAGDHPALQRRVRHRLPAGRAGGHRRPQDRHIRLPAAARQRRLPRARRPPARRRRRAAQRLPRAGNGPQGICSPEVTVRRLMTMVAVAPLVLATLFLPPVHHAGADGLGPPPAAGADSGGGFHGFASFDNHAQAQIVTLTGYLNAFREDDSLGGTANEINGPPANSRNVAAFFERGRGATFVYGVIGGHGGERGTLPDPPPGEANAYYPTSDPPYEMTWSGPITGAGFPRWSTAGSTPRPPRCRPAGPT